MSLAGSLLDRIQTRQARVGIVGLGYVGLPLAETFAWGGFPVLGFDTDPEKVKKLRTGQSYIGHIASERVAELVDSGRFEATFNANCFAEVDAIVICVPTPLTEAREPDLSYILNTGKAISKHLRRGQLVVLESTTYPGTTEEILLPMFTRRGLQVGRDFFLCFSPERVDPVPGRCCRVRRQQQAGGRERRHARGHLARFAQHRATACTAAHVAPDRGGVHLGRLAVGERRDERRDPLALLTRLDPADPLDESAPALGQTPIDLRITFEKAEPISLPK